MKIILHYQEQEMEASPHGRTSKGQSLQQANLERLQKKRLNAPIEWYIEIYQANAGRKTIRYK